MAKIHSLKIKNYRGIKNFEHVFGETDFICLIGRGDSGKSTLLYAISAALTPYWNYTFYDTDFYNCNTENTIEIEVSLYDLPSKLLTESKYGLYKRIVNSNGEIIDDLTNEELRNFTDILTIRLTVKEDLVPNWEIVNERENQDPIEISSYDRAKLNMFMISDYLNKHFSWNRGNPLYSLLKENNENIEHKDLMIDAIRDAKDKVDRNSFDNLNTVLDKVKNTAKKYGLDTNNIDTTIDFKDIFIKEGKVSLHNGNIPYRQQGKGSKRILSIAIQMELAKNGGIILIDELEQGLEPDRVRFLANNLIKQREGQIFAVTHSRNVIIELDPKNLYLIRKNSNKHYVNEFDDDFQGCLRANPEAFFAKKVLVCEGATEYGICRALNDYNIDKGGKSLAILGVVLVDGTGDNMFKYAQQFNSVGFDVCLFCDSDDNSINDKKTSLEKNGVLVVDCEEGNAIENQLFLDLSWEKIKKIIDYAKKVKGKQSIKDSLNNKGIDIDNLNYNQDNRATIGKIAKENNWYKRIDHGQAIGEICFENINENEDKYLYKQFKKLLDWIDNA